MISFSFLNSNRYINIKTAEYNQLKLIKNVLIYLSGYDKYIIIKDMIYMYNFSLKDNENILFEAMNVVAEFNEKKKEIAIVITNKRLIFLKMQIKIPILMF